MLANITQKGALNMYSPKISEELIPIIYHKAKEQKRPMTKVVNDLLREVLIDIESDQKTETTESNEIEIKSKAS